jgi:hypothetical protein
MLPRSRAGLAGALLHLFVVGAVVTLILAGHDPGWPKHWLIMLALDFPVSLGVMPVTWLVPAAKAGPLSDISNFWWPLVYHGAVGTLWWYIVGWAIGRKVTALLARRGSTR